MKTDYLLALRKLLQSVRLLGKEKQGLAQAVFSRWKRNADQGRACCWAVERTRSGTRPTAPLCLKSQGKPHAFEGLWGSSEAPQGRALSLDEACAEILKALSGDCWAVLANMLHWCTRQCLRNGWLSCWFPLFKKGIQESSPIIGVSHCSASKVKLMQGRLKEGSDLLILSNWGGAIQTLYWTWSSGAALCSCRVTRGVMEDSPSSLWLGDGLWSYPPGSL